MDEKLLLNGVNSLQVCDLGCGNGRFGQFCVAQLKHQVSLSYLGVDQDPQLLEIARQTFAASPDTASFQLQHLDIVGTLVAGKTLASQIPLQFSLVVGFGILHHIPSQKLREAFITQLAELVSPGGLLLVACWQFHLNQSLLSRQLTAQQAGFDSAELETNDFFLTWERDTQAVRYAHLVTEIEQDELIRKSDLQLLERFTADGKTGEENTYLVLQKAG